MRSVGRAIALLLLVAVAAGCRVEADVRVTLDDDGSGTVACTVTLDAEAVARVTGIGQRTLEESIPIDDLEAAGWDLNGGWQTEADGGASLQVDHDFANAEELEARLRELDGGTLVVGSDIVRERGLFRTRDELTVEVDLTAVGTRIAADEELAASLQAAGLDVAALDQQLGAELAGALQVDVAVEVPGDRVSEAEVAPGQQQSVTAARSTFDSARLVTVIIGGLVVFLGVLLYLAASASARRTRRLRSATPENERTPLM